MSVVDMSVEARMELAENGDNSTWLDIDDTIPFGEESTLLSNAGGEVELCKALADLPPRRVVLTLQSQCHVTHNCNCRRRAYYRTRLDRTHLMNEAWERQISALVDGYMSWRKASPKHSSPSEETLPDSIEIVIVHFFGMNFNLLGLLSNT